MLNQKLNLYVEQGADHHKEIILCDEFNIAIDLTGKTIVSNIRESVISTSIISFTITVIDLITGKVQISLSNATTSQLIGKYYYAILIDDEVGKYGSIIFNRNII